jgi:hypothetical protein
MKIRLAALALSLALLLPACAASKKQTRAWQAGDSIICPHCGRDFPVPEKLGP